MPQCMIEHKRKSGSIVYCQGEEGHGGKHQWPTAEITSVKVEQAVDFREENDKLRTEVERLRPLLGHYSTVEIAVKARERMDLQYESLVNKMSDWFACGCLGTSNCADHDHDDFLEIIDPPKHVANVKPVSPDDKPIT